MRKQLFILTLLVFGFGCNSIAKQAGTHEKISITMSATESVEADLIIFSINVNAEGDSPRTAFNLHQKRETVLADLLKEMDIEEENINFQPIRINKQYNNNRKSQISATSQQVSVTFSDFDLYETMQLTLIENNFDSFSGNFSSTKLSEGKEKALVAAIEAAKQKAQLIASTSGVTLGGVKAISYSDYTVRPYSNIESNALFKNDASSMMDFSQTVSVTANISIEFEISN